MVSETTNDNQSNEDKSMEQEKFIAQGGKESADSEVKRKQLHGEHLTLTAKHQREPKPTARQHFSSIWQKVANHSGSFSSHFTILRISCFFTLACRNRQPPPPSFGSTWPSGLGNA